MPEDGDLDLAPEEEAGADGRELSPEELLEALARAERLRRLGYGRP